MLKAPGIINDYLPEKNKYTNFKNIETIVFNEITPLQLQRFVNLIKTNYLQNNDNIFSPETENIRSYFNSHNDKSFISFYNEENLIMDLKKGTTITDNKVIGVMTSRPVYIEINNGDKDAKFMAYYVDYLCVKNSHRKKGIAEQIIQTHHYNQRRLNKDVKVSLFKREGELTGIVPLTCYDCFGYDVDKFISKTQYKVNDKYSLVEMGKTNIQVLTDYMKDPENIKRFDVFIYDNYSSLLETINTKNIYIYCVISRETHSVMAIYGFKRSCVSINNKEILTSHFSIKSTFTSEELFYYCFLDSIRLINKALSTNPYRLLAVENISDNQLIINNINRWCKPFVISPTAYFLYNYVFIPVKSNKCVIFL